LPAARAMNFEIKHYSPRDKDHVIVVWENSVLATHPFLERDDFVTIKKMLYNLDFEELRTFCLMSEEGMAGFICIYEVKVEMLFLDPRYIGQGLGTRLMNFAISNFNVTLVDVNEQNSDARKFYEKFGFETFARTEKDGQGKNYPLLKMKRTPN
jgi:putative acetyltransferase